MRNMYIITAIILVCCTNRPDSTTRNDEQALDFVIIQDSEYISVKCPPLPCKVMDKDKIYKDIVNGRHKIILGCCYLGMSRNEFNKKKKIIQNHLTVFGKKFSCKACFYKDKLYEISLEREYRVNVISQEMTRQIFMTQKRISLFVDYRDKRLFYDILTRCEKIYGKADKYLHKVSPIREEEFIRELAPIVVWNFNDIEIGMADNSICYDCEDRNDRRLIVYRRLKSICNEIDSIIADRMEISEEQINFYIDNIEIVK